MLQKTAQGADRMVSFSRFTRYFTAVAGLGSIRKAAAALHVSASAIDRQILAAEQAFGVPLFERRPEGMLLTAAGEILVGATRGWQQDYGAVLAQISQLQGLKRGHVEIVMIDALADGFMPAAIARISAEFPHITFGVRVLNNGAVAEALLGGEADVGLLLEPLSGSDAIARGELHVRCSVDIPLGITMAPGHRLQAQAGLQLRQTSGDTMIMPGPPLMIYERAAELCAAAGFSGRNAITCNNVRMMRALIRQGAGIGILSLLDVLADVEQRVLAFVPLTDPLLRPLRLSLCVASRKHLSKAASMSLSFLEAQMAHLDAGAGRHLTATGSK